MGTRTTYSAFLRGPSAVLPEVEKADVVLERRDGEDLVLTTAGRSQAFAEGLDISVNTLRRLAVSHREIVRDSLADALPWVEWLPESERRDCLDELLTDLAASVAVGDFTRFHRDVVAWRDTARVWSDPDLAEQLTSEFSGEHGRVERPSRDR